MPVALNLEQRKELARIIDRPKSLEQYSRARALFALSRGKEVSAVAKRLRIPVTRVQELLRIYEESGLSVAVNPSDQIKMARRIERSRPLDFESALDYVLEKNAELYHRLAR